MASPPPITMNTPALRRQAICMAEALASPALLGNTIDATRHRSQNNRAQGNLCALQAYSVHHLCCRNQRRCAQSRLASPNFFSRVVCELSCDHLHCLGDIQTIQLVFG